MPHLIIEHSHNLIEKQNLTGLLAQCHQLLAELLPTDINNCKSRVLAYEEYQVGNGDTNNAFVHFNLKILAGRTEDTLNHAGKTLMQVAYDYFHQSNAKLNLQISIEISELASTYFK
jgi:5-carboxymethyl-2-hydroxymuconate isomerase